MVLLDQTGCCRRFHDALTSRPVTIEGLLLRPCEYIKTRSEYPMNASQVTHFKYWKPNRCNGVTRQRATRRTEVQR